jgi:hypothetical protein
MQFLSRCQDWTWPYLLKVLLVIVELKKGKFGKEKVRIIKTILFVIKSYLFSIALLTYLLLITYILQHTFFCENLSTFFSLKIFLLEAVVRSKTGKVGNGLGFNEQQEVRKR